MTDQERQTSRPGPGSDPTSDGQTGPTAEPDASLSAHDSLAVQEVYANVYNEIVKPDKVFVGTQYFRRRWVPLLGPALSWVITALRQHCYWNKGTGEKRDWCLITQEALAQEAGISVATLKRLLKHEHADKFIMQVSHRYRYDARLRKQVRQRSMYQIRMDDPLVPEDEVLLKERLAEQLKGLSVNPETGQIDLLQALDRLSNRGTDDQQLNLSHSPTEADSTPESDPLVEKVSHLLAGVNGHSESDESEPEGTNIYPQADFIPSDKLTHLTLPADQVLLPHPDDGYLAVPIDAVVKRDLRLNGGYVANASRTVCFYSVAHALGEDGEDWLPEEQERMHQMEYLERHLSTQYHHLGAFSLEEALQQYFSPQLTTDLLKDRSEAEQARITDWIAYTRQATGLNHPAGFLRSRIESGEFPPK